MEAKYISINNDEKINVTDKKILSIIDSIDLSRNSIYLMSYQLEIMIEMIELIDSFKNLSQRKKILIVEAITKIHEKDIVEN